MIGYGLHTHLTGFSDPCIQGTLRPPARKASTNASSFFLLFCRLSAVRSFSRASSVLRMSEA